MKVGEDKQLDQALICEKALELSRKVYGETNFVEMEILQRSC